MLSRRFNVREDMLQIATRCLSKPLWCITLSVRGEYDSRSVAMRLTFLFVLSFFLAILTFACLSNKNNDDPYGGNSPTVEFMLTLGPANVTPMPVGVLAVSPPPLGKVVPTPTLRDRISYYAVHPGCDFILNRVAVYAGFADMWSAIARDMDKTRSGEIWRADATAAELTALHCEESREEVERRLKDIYVKERASQTPTATPPP